jgi:lauroyl/myristoyl acyltransferase
VPLIIRLMIGLVTAGLTWTLVDVMESRAQVQIAACATEEEQVKIKALVQEGLENALVDRSYHLFNVWMQDGTDQPRRAQVGLSKAITAYLQSNKGAGLWHTARCDGD